MFSDMSGTERAGPYNGNEVLHFREGWIHSSALSLAEPVKYRCLRVLRFRTWKMTFIFLQPRMQKCANLNLTIHSIQFEIKSNENILKATSQKSRTPMKSKSIIKNHVSPSPHWKWKPLRVNVTESYILRFGNPENIWGCKISLPL